MPRVSNGTIWIAAQATYTTADPSANGSTYVSVPTIGPATKVDNKAQLATGHALGSVFGSVPETGPESSEITFKTYLGGFVASNGAGAAPAADWLDILMLAFLGTNVTRVGLGVGVGSTTTNLVLDAGDPLSIQDIVPVYEAGLAPLRTQWTQVTVDPGTSSYTVAPAFATAPTTAGISYATNQYRFTDGGGAYVACVFRDDTVATYTHLGGRVTLKSISAEYGGLYVAEWSIRFDTRAVDAGKSALPSVLAGPAFRPLKAMRSPISFNGAFLESKSLKIDFAPETKEIGSTAAANGRAGDELIRVMPKVTLEPLRATAIEDYFRNITQGPLMLQLGDGVLSGGQLGTMAVFFDRVHASSVSDSDDGNVSRQQLVFSMHDRAIFSGTTRAVPLQIVRA
ncbi:MAG: hypothetical protein IPG45_05935 [Deltaproteobacteria bacterium]|nr:hypothetical protein [Deltaproteobacteria bacterium]